MIISPEIKYNSTPNHFFIKNDKFKKLEYLSKKKEFKVNETLKESIQQPTIIHFLGGGFWSRPWEENCNHPLKDKYLEYKDKTPFKDIPLYKLDFVPKTVKYSIRYVVCKFPTFLVLLVYRIILIIRY